MLIGYKPQFVRPILSGEKIHTIREDRHNRWKSGRMMHMATGVRTKKYNNFKTEDCTGTQKIEILYPWPWNDSVRVFIDGKIYCGLKVIDDLKRNKSSDVEKLSLLATNDGFDSITDFLNWFNKDYIGKIIHWTNFRYNA